MHLIDAIALFAFVLGPILSFLVSITIIKRGGYGGFFAGIAIITALVALLNLAFLTELAITYVML